MGVVFLLVLWGRRSIASWLQVLDKLTAYWALGLLVFLVSDLVSGSSSAMKAEDDVCLMSVLALVLG